MLLMTSIRLFDKQDIFVAVVFTSPQCLEAVGNDWMNEFREEDSQIQEQKVAKQAQGQEEEEIFYMFRPDNTSDHMQQGLMTLHHIISLQQ